MDHRGLVTLCKLQYATGPTRTVRVHGAVNQAEAPTTTLTRSSPPRSELKWCKTVQSILRSNIYWSVSQKKLYTGQYYLRTTGQYILLRWLQSGHFNNILQIGQNFKDYVKKNQSHRHISFKQTQFKYAFLVPWVPTTMFFIYLIQQAVFHLGGKENW
jgi:hypothetical protein